MTTSGVNRSGSSMSRQRAERDLRSTMRSRTMLAGFWLAASVGFCSWLGHEVAQPQVSPADELILGSMTGFLTFKAANGRFKTRQGAAVVVSNYATTNAVPWQTTRATAAEVARASITPELLPGPAAAAAARLLENYHFPDVPTAAALVIVGTMGAICLRSQYLAGQEQLEAATIQLDQINRTAAA